MELLTNQGWALYYECMCGGSKKRYYSNTHYPGYEITIRPTMNTFCLYSQNRRIYGPDYLYLLEQKLKEYGIYQ